MVGILDVIRALVDGFVPGVGGDQPAAELDRRSAVALLAAGQQQVVAAAAEVHVVARLQQIRTEGVQQNQRPVCTANRQARQGSDEHWSVPQEHEAYQHVPLSLIHPVYMSHPLISGERALKPRLIQPVTAADISKSMNCYKQRVHRTNQPNGSVLTTQQQQRQ